LLFHIFFCISFCISSCIVFYIHFYITFYIMNEDYENVFSKSQTQVNLKIMNKFIRCHVYEEEKKNEFLAWWKKTKWFRRNAKKFSKKQKKIHWKSNKKMNLWTHYVEKVVIIDEISKVICTKCTIILSHSVIETNNSIMIHHLSSKKCKKTFTFKELEQVILKFNKRVIMNDDYQKDY
jgi:hypothetical protein